MTSFKSRLSLRGRNTTSARCITAKRGCNRDSRAWCSQTQTVSRALTQEIKRVTGKRQRKAAADSLRFVHSTPMCNGPLMVARAQLMRGRRRRSQEDRRCRSTQRIWYFCADYTVHDDILTKLAEPQIGVHSRPSHVNVQDEKLIDCELWLFENQL